MIRTIIYLLLELLINQEMGGGNKIDPFALPIAPIVKYGLRGW